MKSNIYFLIRSFLVLLLSSTLLPCISFAQSLAPIPDVGEGVCVANCGNDTSSMSTPTPIPDFISCPDDCSGNGFCNIDGSCTCDFGWTGTNCSSSIYPAPLATPEEPITQTQLESAKELNMQALEELNEGKYVEAKETIDDTIESLNDAKENLRTDPLVLEFCENKPEALDKIERSILSSIKNHTKAASTVDRIIDITSTSNRINDILSDSKREELLKKLIKFTKRLLGRRIPQVRSNAVCGVRG